MVTHDITEDTSSPSQPTVLFTPKERHTATLIFFHGLGDTGRGWRSSLEEFGKKLPHVKIIAPTAPTIPVTVNNGARMPAWFDLTIRSMAPQDMLNLFMSKPPLIDQSAAIVHRLIGAEMKAGIPTSRIILGGFSMGGFVATYVALQLQQRCAGILMMSSMCFGPGHIQVTPEGKKTPCLYFHGDADQMIPLFAAQMSKSKLEELGVAVEFKTWPGLGHEANPNEIKEAIEWVTKQLPAQCSDSAALQELALEQGEVAPRRIPNVSVFLRRLRREDLNGSRGVVKSYNSETGRYNVDCGNGSMALKAENLVQAIKVNYKGESCEVEDIDVTEGLYILSKGKVPAGDVKVAPGSFLRAEGLESAHGSKLNGLYGEVVSYDEGAGRYVLNFGTQDTKLRPQNLFP